MKRLLAFVLVLAMIATLASFPAFAAETISLSATNVITAPTGGTGDLSNLFDGDDATGHLVAYNYSWSGAADTLTSNNVYVIDLGALYENLEMTLVWGGQGTHGWGWTPPGDYTVYYSEDNSSYTQAAKYTDLFANTDNGTLPEGLTASRPYSDEYILTAVTPIAASGVRFIKIEMNSFKNNGIVLDEITVTGDLSATQSGVATSYTVKYVDQNGDPVVETKVVSENVFSDSPVTEVAPVVYGYDNVNTTESITLSANPEENVITFNYIKKTAASYKVEYVDENGTPLADEKVVDYNVFAGDEITEYSIVINGYSIKGDAAITKTLVGGENVFTFTYKVYNSISGPHSAITGLTGENVTTDVAIDSNATDLDKLFDGDTTCYGTSAGVPEEGNGLYGTNWYNDGNKAYIIVDLGDVYELSEIGTYWGWAPAENPNWNNWQYFVPSSYTIYIADTFEGLDSAVPAFVKTGIVKDSETLVADDVATLATWGRFVKIEAVTGGGNFALREITFKGAEFIDPDNNATVTVEYKDESGNTIAPSAEIKKTTGKTFDVEPITIAGYNPVSTTQTVTFDTDKTVTVVYRAIPTIEVAPAEEGTYSDGAKEIPFVFTVATPDDVTPDAFEIGNWVATNCEIKDVKVEADGMLGFVYVWKVVVTVVPEENKEFSVELDLPDTFELTDKISVTRVPSTTTLDSAIMVGENYVELSTDTVVIEVSDTGIVKTDRSKRKILATINLQSVNEDLLPYNGYDEVVVELKQIVSAGQGLSYKVENFVKVGDSYVGELLAHKYGVDKLGFVLVLYGVEADGTKVELDTVTVESGMIQVVAPAAEPESTEAEKAQWKILPIDILSQLIGQVNPSALPAISDNEWAFYEEVVALGDRDHIDLAQLRADYDAYRTSEAVGDFSDELVIDVNKQIQGSVYLWNFLKDVKVEKLTFTNLNVAQVSDEEIEGVNDIVNVKVSFRNGIDYDKLNVLNGGDFNLRVRINLTEADPKANTVGKAYNAVRRALNDDQLMPLFFRLDWYTWAELPFTGAVFTVEVSDRWIDNNGSFNMVAYHLTSYDYDKDNTPVIEKVEDNLTIKPITNEITFAVDGGANGAKVYDTYAIVSTNKLPSELPATIGK